MSDKKNIPAGPSSSNPTGQSAGQPQQSSAVPLPDDQGGAFKHSPPFPCSGRKAVTYEEGSLMAQHVAASESVRNVEIYPPLDDLDRSLLRALQDRYPASFDNLEDLGRAAGTTRKTITPRVERLREPEIGVVHPTALSLTRAGLALVNLLDQRKL
jgi:hypothetical protein